MTLAAGTKLGPYEIVAPLGAGGMGEVYRARDARLGREVAIKVLPQHLSAHPEVRARFEREAKTISGLNHPNICVLHDVGREGETDFLVMELVEGETLAARLRRGALPLADVLRLGAQIADALDRAHRAGVVHRDLKPGNVMVTRSGAKLMDFGLARATAAAGPVSGSGATMTALTQHPTVASPLTAEGAIVGTFQYMAPEQLEGREADARSDLWAFGCVLYEMITGVRAYEGRTQASLISAIMRDTPRPLAELAPMSPPPLARLVTALLAKEPDERIQTAHDVRLQLQWLGEGGGGSQAGAPSAAVTPRRASAWTVPALAALAVAALGWGAFATWRPAPSRTALRAVVNPPPNAVFLFTGDNAGPPVLSPDGTRLAFVAVDNEVGARLWVRDVDELVARPLPGTENATFPFWSYDGRSLGFFAGLKLRRVDLATGQVLAICEAQAGRGGTWAKDDEILFSPYYQSAIYRVRASGGTPQLAVPLDTTRFTTLRWPSLLPDGKHFLYFAGSHDAPAGPNNSVWVASVDGRENRRLFDNLTDAVYAEGRLFFVRDSVLMAQPFDAGSRRLQGDSYPTAERVQFDLSTWKMNFSAAGGLLAYQANGGDQGSRVWLYDRTGHRTTTVPRSGNFFDVDFMPDGRSFLFAWAEKPNADVYQFDFARGTVRPITTGEDDDNMPIASRDGRWVTFARQPASRFGPYSPVFVPLDGSVPPRLVRVSPRDAWALDWAPDGSGVVAVLGSAASYVGDSLLFVPVDGSASRPIAAIPGGVTFGRFSHDGRWFAYSASHDSGNPEVYVRPASWAIGGVDGPRVQATFHGGAIPCWGLDDRELVYVRADGAVCSVPFDRRDGHAGEERVLFRAIVRPTSRGFAVSPDGEHFLVNALASEGAAPVVLVSDWKRGLKAR